MEKKIKIISGILGLLVFVAVGGYFLAGRFGKLPSGKVAYVQPSVASLAQQTVAAGAAENNSQQATDNSQQTVVSDQSPVIGNKQPVANNQPASTGGNQSSSAQGGSSAASSQNTTSGAGKIVARLASWGFQKSSGRTIDTIIVHSSYAATGSDPYSVDGVIAEWKAAGVSPHYLIARDGTTYQLVADQNIAWHAGVSKMPAPDGRTNVNDFSIGVEMINTLDGKFTDAQYASLNWLIASLKSKYPIKNILGHDQISPGRKTDPWGMDWSRVQK